jgi:hypothetical protein
MQACAPRDLAIALPAMIGSCHQATGNDGHARNALIASRCDE